MKILYIHGLSSSGNSGTAACLRSLLPYDTIISPDLPIEPMEALELLKRIVKEEKIDLAIGTSMGGMFAQKLRGTPKFLINPSFHVSQSMRKKLGVNKFFSERQDGISEYEITPELCDRYEELEQTQFDQLGITESFYNTRAFFGSENDVVNCREEYYKYYGQLTIFPGGYRLTEEIIRKYLLRHIERHRRWMMRDILWQNETERLFRETASDSESINLLNHEHFRERLKSHTFNLQELIKKCDRCAAYIRSYAPNEKHNVMLCDVRQFLGKYQGKECSLFISIRYGRDYGYESFCEDSGMGVHTNFIEAIRAELDTDDVRYVFDFNNTPLRATSIEIFLIVGENRNVGVKNKDR